MCSLHIYLWMNKWIHSLDTAATQRWNTIMKLQLVIGNNQPLKVFLNHYLCQRKHGRFSFSNSSQSHGPSIFTCSLWRMVVYSESPWVVKRWGGSFSGERLFSIVSITKQSAARKPAKPGLVPPPEIDSDRLLGPLKVRLSLWASRAWPKWLH